MSTMLSSFASTLESCSSWYHLHLLLMGGGQIKAERIVTIWS